MTPRSLEFLAVDIINDRLTQFTAEPARNPGGNSEEDPNQGSPSAGCQKRFSSVLVGLNFSDKLHCNNLRFIIYSIIGVANFAN